jgi:hypothetical protein
MNPASASTSPISQTILHFPHLMELPDPNRFTSTPEYRQLVDTTTSSKYSSDILSTTKYYLATDDDVEEQELTDPKIEDDIMYLGEEDLLRLKAEMMAGLPTLPLEEELFTPLAKSASARDEEAKKNKHKSTVSRTNPSRSGDNG